MKEIPLLCSTPVVQSMLEGRKTQTRRLIKPQAMVNEKGQLVWANAPASKTRQIEKGLPMSYGLKDYCPYQICDILYVRETWVKACLSEDGEGPIDGESWKYWYKADKEWTKHDWHDPKVDGPVDAPKWKPSIHMPKEAARIWLQVTDVRVERLQDITITDAKAEGVQPYHNTELYTNYLDGTWVANAWASFGSLWAKINGMGSWDANPWVWVVTFDILSTSGKPKLVNK